MKPDQEKLVTSPEVSVAPLDICPAGVAVALRTVATKLERIISALERPVALTESASTVPPTPREGWENNLRDFLTQRIVESADSDLTVEDLIEAFEEVSQYLGHQPVPRAKVQRVLSRLMLEIHHASQCHGVMRGNRQLRGFRHVTFRGC